MASSDIHQGRGGPCTIIDLRVDVFFTVSFGPSSKFCPGLVRLCCTQLSRLTQAFTADLHAGKFAFACFCPSTGATFPTELAGS